MDIAPFHSQNRGLRKKRGFVHENEKGLCAYEIYMYITPFHSQPSILLSNRPRPCLPLPPKGGSKNRGENSQTAPIHINCKKSSLLLYSLMPGAPQHSHRTLPPELVETSHKLSCEILVKYMYSVYCLRHSTVF